MGAKQPFMSRKLFGCRFVDHSNFSLALWPHGNSLHNIQNGRHRLDCRTLKCAAGLLEKVTAAPDDILLKLRCPCLLGKLSVFCDAIDGEKRLFILSFASYAESNNRQFIHAIRLFHKSG